MKILELCLSDGIGGLELYVLRTARQLLRLGHESFAVAAEGTMLSERLKSERIRTIALHRSNRILPLAAARRLAGVIDREAPDVVHMHWGPDLNLAALAKCFAKRKTKLLYTRQMMITRSKKDWYHRLLYRQIDLYLAISRQLRDKARAYLPLPEHAVQLLYYGVQQPGKISAEKRHVIRRELGIDDSVDVAIGLVGRMEEKKGQHLLVDAMQMLHSQHLKVHAVFIGPVMNKPYYSRLQQQVADQQLQRHVTFYGSHSNPVDIMAAFDIVVLATEMETFGLVLIEAMRSGAAVVGSNAGGVPEIIEDEVSGLLFEPGSSTDLAEKLKRYCTQPQFRLKVAAAGKTRADDLFSLERHYRDLEQILRNLSSSGSDAGSRRR